MVSKDVLGGVGSEHDKWYDGVNIILVLAQIELIFFGDTLMMLCFGFLMKTMVITYQWCSCCRAVLTQSFCFLCCPASKEAGGAQEAGRGHSQDS